MAENKKAASALVEQIKQKILGEYGGHYGFMALPGERELAARYGVSRPTLHKALLLLEDDGKIVRVDGKGSFFMGEKKFENLSRTRVFGFSEMLSARGVPYGAKMLMQNVEPADEKIAGIFSIEAGDQVFHLRSLAYVEEKLYAMTDDYVNMKLCPGLSKLDFTRTSLLQALERFGFVIDHMKGLLEIRPANSYEAMNLELKLGDPITIFRNTGYDKNETAFMHSVVRSLAYETSYEIYTERVN